MASCILLPIFYLHLTVGAITQASIITAKQEEYWMPCGRKMEREIFSICSTQSTSKSVLCRKEMVINGQILLITCLLFLKYWLCMQSTVMSNFIKTVQTLHVPFYTERVTR